MEQLLIRSAPSSENLVYTLKQLHYVIETITKNNNDKAAMERQ